MSIGYLSHTDKICSSLSAGIIRVSRFEELNHRPSPEKGIRFLTESLRLLSELPTCELHSNSASILLNARSSLSKDPRFSVFTLGSPPSSDTALVNADEVAHSMRVLRGWLYNHKPTPPEQVVIWRELDCGHASLKVTTDVNI